MDAFLSQSVRSLIPHLNAVIYSCTCAKPRNWTCSPECSFVLFQLHLVQCWTLYGVDETHQWGPLSCPGFGRTENGFWEILVQECSSHLCSQLSFILTSGLYHLLPRQQWTKQVSGRDSTAFWPSAIFSPLLGNWQIHCDILNQSTLPKICRNLRLLDFWLKQAIWRLNLYLKRMWWALSHCSHLF